MNTVSMLLHNAMLELRCNPAQLAKELGESEIDMQSWVDGKAIPPNPIMLFHAVKHLEYLWHVQTEPGYKKLDQIRDINQEAKNTIELSRRVRAEVTKKQSDKKILETLIAECDSKIAQSKIKRNQILLMEGYGRD